ncbi:MAG: RagB/SusD family nutrient uptake outer membrane protein [Tannerellaceae bacterium]|nr:RagB/SusD family nutrient uptake outer membrane protein [Tannerellaceae bacterium]
MKNSQFFIVILLTSILFSHSSCINDFLDRKPLDVVSDDNIWSNESAILAYMASMYDYIQTEPHSWLMNWNTLGHFTDESMRSYSWGHPYTPTFSDDYLDEWDSTYRKIRMINDFLKNIERATINEDLKQRYTAEAHFIRAFNYFTLVKRYGGVPILKDAQEYVGDVELLKVSRDTEEATWNFIAEECDLAIAALPESYADAEQYRATKYAAYALKSRAMLYAGSISKYGNVQLNGLVGIPADKANDFFEKSLNASEAIIRSGKFALYQKEADKAKNFQYLFLDKTLHEEAIFVKAFSAPDKGHSFDFAMAAPSFKIDYGTNTSPTLELVEEFEYTDGTNGALKLTDANGQSIIYDHPEDIFKDKDPRFFASVLYPNSPWQGSVLEIRRGIIGSDGVKVEASAFTDKFPEDPSLTTSGKDGLVLQGDCSRTGFYIKKFMDPVNRLDQFRSETNFMVFRYAEILLNYAEAAAELDKTEDALPTYNEVRKRAGIAEKTSVTMDDIRRERRIELAFENHRYWDLVRWRIATKAMNNTMFSALIPWMDYKTRKYQFEKGDNTLRLPKTFLEKNYYQKIPGISSNELLIQNPGF